MDCELLCACWPYFCRYARTFSPSLARGGLSTTPSPGRLWPVPAPCAPACTEGCFFEEDEEESHVALGGGSGLRLEEEGAIGELGERTLPVDARDDAAGSIIGRLVRA